MELISSRKRSQYSSCDACRQSRVACDASRQGHQPGQVTWRGACSRCSKRERQCTFQWFKDTRKPPAGTQTTTYPFVPYEPLIKLPILEQNQASPAAIGPSQHCTFSHNLFAQWCGIIFDRSFEIVSGLSLGRYSCPLVRSDPMCDPINSPTQIFWKLDAYLGGSPDLKFTSGDTEKTNAQIDKSLTIAIHAFAAPWFLLVSQEHGLQTAQVLEVIRTNWRAARQEMLKAINYTSYRSILALYLFAQTPVPVGLSEHEELDGISGPACIQTAVSHLQRLRARRNSRQLGSSAPATSSDSFKEISTFLDWESRSYWAAITWDTSMSLGSDFRTSLTSGLQGACSEPTWRLVKAFLTGSFVPKAEKWRGEEFEPTDEIADEIVSAASICKTYIWKNITSLKEAIREGVHEDSVIFAWKALLAAIDIFNASIRPLLQNRKLQLHCLDQGLRLKWYQVNLQHFLGILLLIESLENAARFDLLQEISAMKEDAEHEAFSILKFGLENTYTIAGPLEGEVRDELRGSKITATLVAIDPDPQYVVDCVTLLHKSIRVRERNDALHDRYSNSLSILLHTLRQLPQSSKSVQTALAKLGS